MVFCTLFDSNYLDRAIVMINSLFRVAPNSKLYVLCMDQRCLKIMGDLYKTVIAIPLKDFEDEELLSVKEQRSNAEYNWTCTAKLIKYVLTVYSETACTYIDADMRFYSDPIVLLNEMHDTGCTVQVVPHRFPPTKRGMRREKYSGRICVQHHTFTEDDNSLALLDKWANQCIQDCSAENIGDQKYTDSWCELPFVNVSSNIGAGVAPWNSTRYQMRNTDGTCIYDRYNKTTGNLIFYHFQNLTFPDENHAIVEPLLQYWNIDKTWIRTIYSQYLTELIEARNQLKEQYSFCPLVKKYISAEVFKNRTIKDKLKDIATIPLYEKVERVSNKIRRIIRKREATFNLQQLVEKE